MQILQFSRIITRTISISAVLLQRPSHPLYPKVDWAEVEGGSYAVIDPMDKHAILYLTAREYKVQVRVSQSQDSSLVVLARPGDLRVPTPSDSPPEEGPPLPPKKEVVKWRRFLTWHLSRLASLFKEDKNGDLVVVPSAEMLMTIVPYWGLTTSYWLGGPLLPSRSLRSSVFQMARHFAQISKSQGTQTLILRMKNALFLLNRYLARQDGRNGWLLGIPVGLTKAGLPKLIPVALRRRIAAKDSAAIRIVASILGAYKAFEGHHDYQLLETITGPAPALDPDMMQKFSAFCQKEFWGVVKHHAGSEWSRLSHPSLRAGENSVPHTPYSAGPNKNPGILGCLDDAFAWSLAPWNWPILWATHVGDMRTVDLYSRILERIGRFTPEERQAVFPKPVHTGKVTLLPEPAGKVRTVAIVDYWTQRLMKPVHRWMMDVLRVLPGDATFDQQGRLRSYAQEFPNHKHYSIDLKSATDLIPIELYRTVFNGIWPSETVDLWISLMTDRWFHVPKGSKKNPSLARYAVQGTDIQYQRGQPMGALSSWASMGIVHHALVLFSAHLADINPSSFTEYRVLGDDNVMANEAVRAKYLEVTSALCVPTSPAKTLEGDLFIFASQAYREGINLSPLSLKEEVGIKTPAQRLEMALRAVERGWAGEGEAPVSVARFLRLLLCHRDYRLSTKEFAKGKLGSIAQAALASALGAFGRVSDRLGLQGPGMLPFLNALANKVEVLAGSEANHHSSIEKSMGGMVREIDLLFGIRAVAKLRSELSRMSDTLWFSAKRFTEWREGVRDCGHLPTSYQEMPGYSGENGILLNFYEHRDRGEPFWVSRFGPEIGPRTKEQSQEWDLFLVSRLWQPIFWLVLEDTFTPIFGYEIYEEIEAEEDGSGMSFSTEGQTVSASSGVMTPTPLLVRDMEGLRDKMDTTLQRYVNATEEDLESPEYSRALWSDVNQLLDLIAKVRRLPRFLTVGDFMKSVPSKTEYDSLKDWGNRMAHYRKIMRSWPLEVNFRVDQLPKEAGALDTYVSSALGLEGNP